MRALLFILVVHIVCAHGKKTMERDHYSFEIPGFHEANLQFSNDDSELPEFPPEPTDPRFDPKRGQVNFTALIIQLKTRGIFNSSFVSFNKPKEFLKKEYTFPFHRNERGRLTPKHHYVLPHYLNKEFRKVLMPNGRRLPIVKSDRINLKIQNTLWAHTACSVQFTWRDLGKRFFPRWVKYGECVNIKGTSCSIPPGMNCQIAQKVTVPLMRYFCIRNDERFDCKWLNYDHEIVTKCQCRCPKN